MGAQQLLLIVLTVIIIGISVAVGIGLFTQNMIRSNRFAVINDLGVFAAVAATYYKTPTDMGGGDGTWDADALGVWLGNNYDEANNSISTNNGTYVISVAGDELTIVGTGIEQGNDGSSNVRATLVFMGSTSEFVTTIEN